VSDILNFAFSENARTSLAEHRSGQQPSSDQHIAKCRGIAAEAERLALSVGGEARGGFVKLVGKLLALADEMEQGNRPGPNPAAPVDSPGVQSPRHGRCPQAS